MRPPPLALILALSLCACARSAGDFGPPPDPTVDLAASGEADLSGSIGPIDLAGGQAGDLAMSMPDSATPDLMPPVDLAKITNCSILPQSGCPTTQKCTTRDGLTTVCDPEGPNTRGQVCTTTNNVDSCAKGLVCADAGKGKGECRLFCATDADCGPRAYCQYTIDPGNFRLCSQACNAIYPGAGCAAGLGCYVAANERTDCKAPGTAGDNAPCTTATDCKPGMVCYGPVGSSVCHRVCKKGDPSQCLGTDECYNIQTWTSYGICCHWFNGC